MIVDDHCLVREGIKGVLKSDDEIDVVCEANDGLECLTKLNQKVCTPNVILLDFTMPIMDGLQALKLIRKNRSLRPRVLMLTGHNEIDYLLPAYKAGVDGYILKNTNSNELINAIHLIYQGERFIQPCLIPLLNCSFITKDMDKNKIDLLTNRESEVLKLVASGFLNKDIGYMLKISERTVKNHLFNIYRKIECDDRTQATIFCIRNGLVPLYE
jgi:DNA-binding NarL/FixJ family response regulator